MPNLALIETTKLATVPNTQGGYQGAANPDKSFSHGKKGSTVYKVSVAQLQLQGKIFRLFSPHSLWDTFPGY